LLEVEFVFSVFELIMSISILSCSLNGAVFYWTLFASTEYQIVPVQSSDQDTRMSYPQTWTQPALNEPPGTRRYGSRL